MIRLKHLSGSLQGRTTELAKPVLRIGRAPDCDVRFDQVKDPKVSNHHAELLLEEGNWFVVDTASTNGTLINGRRVTKHRLTSGDKVQFSTKAKTKKRWVKVVAAVAGAAALVVSVMSVVIVQQQRQIARLVQTKNKLDKEIQQVQAAMESETDADKLEQLEQRLAQLA